MKKSTQTSISDPLSMIPSFVKIPEGVFEDIEHYRSVAEGVTRALAAARHTRHSPSSSGSSLYEGIRIEFSTQYQEEEIFLDAYSSKVILRAPKKKGEPASSLQVRRMHYLEQLLRPVEAMKTIGIAQIYLSLKEEGRKKVSKKRRGSL